MYYTHLDLGIAEPLPAYFHEVQLARWLGITRDELDDMPICEVEEARVVMSALNQAERDAYQKARK